MKDFVTINNVPFSWEERLHDLVSYTLYVSDCFWMLDTKEYYEFYYNPRHFIGKIALADMPSSVLTRIRNCSAVFNKGEIEYGLIEQKVLHNTSIRFRMLERDMRIGNWFHAQGQNYATWKARFICDDMYVEGLERDCSLKEINAGIVYDMMRMGCQSRTPHYIKSLFDLSVFAGVDASKIVVLPFDNAGWNPAEWVKKFNAHNEYVVKNNDKWDMEQIRGMRAEVFKHTVGTVREGGYMLDGERYTFSEDAARSMIEDTCFYDKQFSVSAIPERKESTIIRVENSDCLLVAKDLQMQGYNPAVLNMASRRNPGGGVLGGAGAQEENLFRRTNLFLSMFQYAPYADQYGLRKSQHQYPLDREFGGVYTPNALVFRGEEKDGYPLLGKDSFEMSFIAVAGINRRDLKDATHLADSMIEGTKNKMRTILRIGLRHGHDSLVLGALGCGAFCNPPVHIAKLFHEVFEEPEFMNKYRLISFAILDDHNAYRSHNPEGNYKPFVDEFADIEKKKDQPSPDVLKALMMWKMGAGNSAKRFNGEDPMPVKTVVATKDSWSSKPMPERHTVIPVNVVIPDKAMEYIKYGHIPEAMEDHWFMYCDDNTIRYYRSWTGFCIYVAKYEKVNEGYRITELTVNRYPEQYNCNDDKHDLAMFMALLTEEYGGDASDFWNAAF